MFELLVRLECEVEALRRQLLKSSVRYNNSYFGAALIVLAVSMFTGPLELVFVPFASIPVAFLFIVGLFLVASVILLPYGLLLW